ncbi:MAG: six-cysteine peptide SCIFF [Firmicutes bacterium]|nr:six-cysteine peptide SCIFF [Bacillota bacterium]
MRGGIILKRDTKHILTVVKPSLTQTVANGGCGECQSSCQSACKTSCTVGNQVCQKEQ